ncbi:MAG: HD domain-containing protein [Nitrospinae bacterium]|nr:HD domain-containing protein [Nitrospinota bacterium]
MNSKLIDNIKSLPFIKTVKAISDEINVEVYLVGGIVRDMIIAQGSVQNQFQDNGLDIDFAIDGDALLFGKRVGDSVGGSYFPLDEERSVSRVVIKQSPVNSHQSIVKMNEIILDFSRIRGEGIEDDLKLRDFTINAVALNLDDLFKDAELHYIDPTGGITDINNRVIKVYDKGVIDDDPLRMLRAIRFESQLGFLIDDKLEVLIKENGQKIKKTSGERIRDELFNILSGDKSHIYIQRLKDLSLLKEIIPEITPPSIPPLTSPLSPPSEGGEGEVLRGGVGGVLEQGRHHKYFLWEHSINTLKTLEVLIENLQRKFPDRYIQLYEMLSNVLEQGISAKEALKLSSIMHDIRKPLTKELDKNGNVHFINHEKLSADITEKLCRRLRLGNNICKTMTAIVRNHMRPILLSNEKKVTNRAIFRFFRDTKEAGVLISLLSIADINATRGSGIFDDTAEDIEGLVKRMIDYYFEDFIRQINSPLISGDEIMKRLNLKSGPEIGELLKEIEEMRAEGIISNKEDAIKFLETDKFLDV